ncbi:hypothetical protein [Halocatena halophila]|uniref:hypothetical protein n=1 Tax=Halocatena halophila TaxID=2814576 RepID=UPI002ED51455
MVFHKSLRTANGESVTEHELDDLTDIGDNCRTVIERLYLLAAADDETYCMVFWSGQEAVPRVAQEINAVYGYDLATNPQLEQALKRAVTEAYEESVGSFSECPVDVGLDQQFVAEANIDELQDRLTEMHRLCHSLGDGPGRRKVSQMMDPQAFEFVSRLVLETTVMSRVCWFLAQVERASIGQ